jgi:hypothetical protein
MPAIDRLVPIAFVVHRHRTPLGEHLPLLVDAFTGMPPVLPLRFALYQRDQGSSSRLLQLLRRIGDLYDWATNAEGIDLDGQFRAGKGIRVDQIARALQELELPSSPGAQISPRPRLRNARCSAWTEFLRFVYRPSLWRTGLSVVESHALRHESERDLGVLVAELNRERQFVADSTPHTALSGEELDAIDEVLDPSHSGNPFAQDMALRNRVLYDIARYGGLRVGELLKLQVSDAPLPEGTGDRLVRKLRGDPRSVLVVRRPDDLEDSRAYEPSVKRRDREVSLPDDVVDELLEYTRSTRQTRKTSYLFCTDDHRHPLSQSRANKIIRSLGAAASLAFQAKHGPSSSNSLVSLTWHRLRHTRALELVNVFFPDLDFDPRSEKSIREQNAFLQFFGWSDPVSARPYIEPMYKIDASRRIREHYAELRVTQS